MRKVKIHGIYQHFKGDYYIVEDLAINSEDLSTCVVYRSLYGDGTLYVRPLELFLGEVDHKKYPNVKKKYSFTLVKVKSVRK